MGGEGGREELILTAALRMLVFICVLRIVYYNDGNVFFFESLDTGMIIGACFLT